MNRLTVPIELKAIIGALFICATVQAQIPAARLEGLVYNARGAPVSGASVTAVQDKAGWRAVVQSDATGRYAFPALLPGSYTVTVEAKGFRPFAHTNVMLGSLRIVEENFVLQIGGSNEPIAEDAPRERLSRMVSEVSHTLTRRELEALPQLDRTPLPLSVFQSGILIKGGVPGSSSVNGTQQTSNNLSLDGLEVNDPVDPRLGRSTVPMNTETIEQITVVTNGGQAEFGRNAGAQVMMVTRSGGKRWSGNAFGYVRNRYADANDFFSNAANIKKSQFRQNIYGASLGGPVIKDRTFVFANYQHRGTVAEIPRNRMVLTQAAKSGLFQWIPPGGSTANSFDIVKNDPRKLGIDPKVGALLAKLPDPNNTDIGDGLNTGGFRFNASDNSDEDQATLRADHGLSAKNRLFARFAYVRSSAIDSMRGAEATFPGAPAGMEVRRHWDVSPGWDWTLSPNTVNQLRAGYQSGKTNLERPSRIAGPMLLPNSWTNPLDPSFPQWYDSPVLLVTDNLTHIRGRHAFKAGLTFRYTSQKSQYDVGIYPNVSFGRGHGNVPASSIGPARNILSQADRQTFENLYNDLLGRMEQVTQTFYGDLQAYLPAGTGRIRDYSFKDYGAFLQDDWKLRANLTLNLGIRYEVNGVPVERRGIQGALDKAANVSSTANIADFTIQRGGKWYKNDTLAFGPRAGFAWAPFNNAKMIVRGGFGIFFDRLAGVTANIVDSHTPGTSQAVAAFPNQAGSDIRLSNGIPTLSPGTLLPKLPNSRSTSAAIFNHDLRIPRVQHFHLTLEREVLRNTIIEVGYVGERGTKLFTSLNLNQLKIEGGFLQAFKEIQKFRADGTPVSSANTLARVFGSVSAAIAAMGGTNLDQGLAGLAADTVDRNYFGRYPAAGVSDFYLRNFPQYNQFFAGTNDGKSSFDSLQISLRHQSGPLKAVGNYTWSKSFDNIATACDECTIPLQSFDAKLNRAPSDFDRRMVMSAWLVYTLPIGRSQPLAADAPGWINALIGNWDLGALVVKESGPRFSVSSGRQTARAGIDSFANYTGSKQIGDVQRKGDGVYWFTADQIKAFTFPVAGEAGSSGRNSFVGPDYFNLDMSLIKRFPIGGERRILIRGEVYNLLNTPHFGVPETNLNNPATFGKFTSTLGNPRIFQVALRFDF